MNIAEKADFSAIQLCLTINRVILYTLRRKKIISIKLKIRKKVRVFVNSKELIKNIYIVIEESHRNHKRVFKGRLSGISKIVNVWEKSGAAWNFLYDK